MTQDEVKELMNKGFITQVMNPTDVVNNMETEPGSCDYKLPTASADVLGGIMVGDGLDIDSTGKLKVNIGSALDIIDGKLGVKIGSGLSVDGNGKLYATESGSDYELGTGLGLNADGKLHVQCGSGLTMDGNELIVKIGTEGGLTIDAGGKLGVNVGNGLTIDADGKLNTTGGGSDYELPMASDTTLGGVKVGTQIGDSTCPYAKIGINSTTGEIGLNYGSGLSVDDNGKLYATSAGSIPTATKSILGGVRVGTTLTVNNEGVIETKFPSKSGMKHTSGSGNAETEGWYINCGDGLTIDANGKLCTTGSGSDYELPTATKTTLGGIKIGTGFNSNSCVKLGIDDETGIACVSCGDGLKVNSNSQCIEVNIDTIYQQILTKLRNDGHIQ